MEQAVHIFTAIADDLQTKITALTKVTDKFALNTLSIQVLFINCSFYLFWTNIHATCGALRQL